MPASIRLGATRPPKTVDAAPSPPEAPAPPEAAPDDAPAIADDRHNPATAEERKRRETSRAMARALKRFDKTTALPPLVGRPDPVPQAQERERLQTRDKYLTDDERFLQVGATNEPRRVRIINRAASVLRMLRMLGASAQTLTREDVQKLITMIAQRTDWRPQTRVEYLTVARRLIEWLIEINRYDQSVLLSLRRAKLPIAAHERLPEASRRALLPVQLDALWALRDRTLAVARTRLFQAQMFRMVDSAIGTACRPSELYGMMIEQYDAATGVITIPPIDEARRRAARFGAAMSDDARTKTGGEVIKLCPWAKEVFDAQRAFRLETMARPPGIRCSCSSARSGPTTDSSSSTTSCR